MSQPIEELVLDALKTNEKYRSSNELLFGAVCKRINLIATQEPFYTCICRIHEYDFPTFVQVIRIKQNIFEEHPELRPKDMDNGVRFEQKIMKREEEL